jgi:triacylglycerol lipase
MTDLPLPPVVLVHGFGENGSRLKPLAEWLRSHGRVVQIFRFPERFGQASILTIAAELAEFARRFGAECHASKVDLVGFSMGALIARTYVQRAGGRHLVRRFVSISGPHHGTWTAYLVPARLLGLPACKEMRPGSELLESLNQEADPWGSVEVHTIRSSFDYMIVPARSSELPGARSAACFWIPVHHLVQKNRRVLRVTGELLQARPSSAGSA